MVSAVTEVTEYKEKAKMNNTNRNERESVISFSSINQLLNREKKQLRYLAKM